MATYENIEQRRSRMSGLLLRKGLLSHSELCRQLDISESTVRRDLEFLEQQGHVKRTHGGAVCMRYAPQQPLAFAERQDSMTHEKESIARAIAGEIEDGQTVILDGGTTTLAVAVALQGRHISVVTNSVPIASLLSADIATEVTLIGGYLYPRTGVALGDTAMSQLALLRASVVVMSSASLGDEGVFNTNQMMVDVERQMMQVAERTILAVDHTKFELHGLVKLCEIKQIGMIVTDGGASPKHRKWLASLPIKTIVA
jgi:DeoR family transcriptional regulator, fructose operon transcriptional repressor